MIPNVMPSVLLSVNLLNAIHHVRNLRMLYVMLSVRNLIVKLCALIRHVKWMIVPSVSLSAKSPIVSLIVRYPSLNVKPFVKNPSVTGSVSSPSALSPNVSWYVKTPIAELKLNVVVAMQVEP
jgi:hypothetical protein